MTEYEPDRPAPALEEDEDGGAEHFGPEEAEEAEEGEEGEEGVEMFGPESDDDEADAEDED